MARYWSILDVALIHLKKSDLFRTVIPSKMFECMGMGVPILHGVEGESAEIVTRCDVGQLFEPENARALADRLKALQADPAERARLAANGPAAARQFDRGVLAGRMLDILQGAAR